jgi:hypothetical protein
MDQWNDPNLPDDLSRVAEHLRASRYEAGPLELDELKRRAMAQSARASGSRQGKGLFMRSKIVSLLLVLGLALSGGAAGVIAGGSGGSNGSAGKSQYKPGKGCGDKNHTHTGPPGNPSNTDCPNK